MELTIQQNERFDLYVYDEDTGALLRVVRDIDKTLARPMAADLHCMENVLVKVVDQFDGCVVYTFGDCNE